MKKIVLIISFLLLINIVEARYLVTYESCVDGDTIWVNKEGESIKVRLISINAPEIEHENNVAEEYANEAKEFVCNTLNSANKVELEYDNNSKKEDKYGRTLAWIWVDDKLLQKLIIKEGLAKVDYVYKEYEYSKELCMIEKRAVKENKGIWTIKKEEGYCKDIDVEEMKLDEEDFIITDTLIYIVIGLFFVLCLLIFILVKKN